MRIHGLLEPLKETINSLTHSTIYVIKNTASNKAMQYMLAKMGGIADSAAPEIRLIAAISTDLMQKRENAPKVSTAQIVTTSVAYTAAAVVSERMISSASIMAASAVVGVVVAPYAAIPLGLAASSIVTKASSHAVNVLFAATKNPPVKKVPVAVNKKAGARRAVRRKAA